MADGAIGATFKIVRVFQAACMFAIIGMTSNFVAQIVAANATPPSVLVGTLSIVCIAVLYCIITFILYLDNLLPLLVATAIDCVFLIALVIVTVIVGRPLSYVDCVVVGKVSQLASDTPSFASALGSSIAGSGTIHYGDWMRTSKSTCLEMKSIWGLSIALCILFTLSATTIVFLWKRVRQIANVTKGEA